MNKYPDCESCAFGDGEAPGICDMCDDGDQWEPMEDYDMAGSRNVIKIVRKRPRREEEKVAA